MSKETNKLEIEITQEDSDRGFSNYAYYLCGFCEKNFKLSKNKNQLYEKLSNGKIHCNFCLQNNFHHKSNKNILILSFKAIIGYYYEYFYSEKKEISYSELKDYIEIHKKVGLLNPVFRYDDESMLFFVDFSKIGRGKHKMPVKEVYKTIVNILFCFNFESMFWSTIKTDKLFEKYQEAIEKFHINRYRPEDRKILCPTLTGISSVADNINHEPFKDFSEKKLILKY